MLCVSAIVVFPFVSRLGVNRRVWSPRWPDSSRPQPNQAPRSPRTRYTTSTYMTPLHLGSGGGGNVPMMEVDVKALPLRHLSVRVPWHDSRWAGTICTSPLENASCLVLPRVRDGRDDDLEVEHAGESWDQIAPHARPPCMFERASFMSPARARVRGEAPISGLRASGPRDGARAGLRGGVRSVSLAHERAC